MSEEKPKEEQGFNFPPNVIIPTPEDEGTFLQFYVPEILPLLPLRNSVLFPTIAMPITIGRKASIAAIQHAQSLDLPLGIVFQKRAEVDNPTAKDIYSVGVAARIIRVLPIEKEGMVVLVQGLRRFKIFEVIHTEPFLKASVHALPDIYDPHSVSLRAKVQTIKQLAREVISMMPEVPKTAATFIDQVESPLFVINFIAAHLDIHIKEKVDILAIDSYEEKADKVITHLVEQKEVLQVKKEIQERIHKELEKQQRQFILQQQLKSIQEELGIEGGDPEIQRLKEKAKKTKLPPHAKKIFEREITKLARMHPAVPEYTVTLNYLDLLTDLPWGKYTKDNYNLKHAREILDRDHYNLDRVKERIIEYLAVLKLKKDMKAPILLFVGPPGVGKTSLGKSIAQALGRKFVRMSLGGLHDEAEIRGHRRTYIGAMPGRIIQMIRRAGSANPVLMLDEIDKIGRDFRGDPAAALLEVLDPEQNHSFYDNYLECEFDLSKVLFIATANTTVTIHPALLDRMEIIHLPGYSTEEKVEIARHHLIPKVANEHGLATEHLKFTPAALRHLIERYTRESGVRNLEKQIAAIARKRATLLASGKKQLPVITVKEVRKTLGPEKFDYETYEDLQIPGVAIALAWTPTGGEILYIEATLFRGKGELKLTGSLGEIMKESASLALSYIKAHAQELDIDPQVFSCWDVHVHIPEGAIPKDGPSAGTAILTALTSLFTQRPATKNFAMTGEITLRGKVLPVGGIKEKLLAARRAGIKNVILPEGNRKDLEDLSRDEHRFVRKLKLHFVESVDQLLRLSLSSRRARNAIDLTQPLHQRPYAQA